MLKDRKLLRPPRKWVTRLYQMLSAGRYAAAWSVEFLILYELNAHEHGQEKADLWALEELALTLKPSIAYRIYRLFRVIYSGWRLYRRIAGE
jgi:hypothetical protein